MERTTTNSRQPTSAGLSLDETARNAALKRRHFVRLAGWALAVALVGCVAETPQHDLVVDRGHADVDAAQSDILQLTQSELVEQTPSPDAGLRPHTIREDDLTPDNYRDMSLGEAVQHALTKTKVLRDLGGALLRSPDLVATKFLPPSVASDPRFGIESALSEFDPRFTASGDFEKNHRAFNNIFFGGGTRLFKQDLNVYQAQISKTAATGSQFFVRNFTDYNANNAPGNEFPSAWNSNFEMEVRQPLLQGAGVDFNRIAGPKATPGMINGVVIARVSAKISQADFEMGLRDFVSNVMNAYWDLYFAYRDLDAKIKARDKSFHTWQKIQALARDSQLVGSDRQALAEEQYFRFHEEVENSLSGKQFDGTRTFSGTTGGTFRGQGGVHVAERRLRLLIGFPITDPKLIRPSDEPGLAELIFDYDSSVVEALGRRPELRRQRLKTERREMELVATKSFLKPQLDAMGLYRFRGFGRDLAGGSGNGQFNSAWGNLATGNFQEWQLGFQLDVPIGFRRAHAAVHAAELNLARERAVLFEQERQVIHDLSNSLAEADRAYAVCQTNLNRYRAAKNLVRALEARAQNAKQTADLLDKLLDAHRRLPTPKAGTSSPARNMKWLLKTSTLRRAPSSSIMT